MADADTRAGERPGRGVLERARRAAAAWLIGRPPIGTRPDQAPAPDLEDLDVVIAALPDPAVLIDSDAKVAAANPAARRRWGSVGPGMRLSALIRHPTLLDAAQAILHDEVARTVDYIAAGPVEEHFECRLAPLMWRGRKAALIVFRDRTAQINSERMRVDFVANASHELRTPLTALSMLIETIAGPARDDAADRSRFLAMMQIQADRMRRLIDDLLALSRIELDERVPPSGSADLTAVAREAADNAAQIAGARGVRVDVAAPAGETRIVGDRFQIAQVAQNLIDNAIKFAPENGVVNVEIGAAEDREDAFEKAGRRWAEAGRVSILIPAPAPGAAERTYAYLRVEDGGPGIARHFLPRLGERFYRVEREEGNDRGGTGLGLAIVKHIVNRCRGGFVVESEPGQGSAFAIYLERTGRAEGRTAP